MKPHNSISRLKIILIDKFGIDENEITLEANFFKDLGIDSLDYAELIMECEKEFDIKILDEYIEEIKTVEELLFYIENYEEKKNSKNKEKFKIENQNAT